MRRRKQQIHPICRLGNLEDHTVGFRQSTQYLEWKKLLHHYYDPFPIVEHYEIVMENKKQLLVT